VLNCLKFPDFFRHRTPYAKLRMIDLVIKRLSLTRFAMQHFIGSLLNRIMTMLHGVSFQLDEKVENCRNVSELILLHNAFVEAVYGHALLEPESSHSYEIIIQLLQLADVLKKEWSNVMTFATLDKEGNVDSQTLADLNTNSLEIEKAFGVCEYHLKLVLDL
jgi:Gamma tubulin complex component C-terminal